LAIKKNNNRKAKTDRRGQKKRKDEDVQIALVDVRRAPCPAS